MNCRLQLRNWKGFFAAELQPLGPWLSCSEFHMQPEPGDNHRPTVFVIAGMRRPLEFRRKIHAAPKVRVVIRLKNIFAAIGEAAIAQQKAVSTQREIKL